MSVGPPPPADSPELLRWRARQASPWLISITVMLAAFMEVLDTSIAIVALPHIAGNLSVSVDESTWVLTSYLVANAVVLPLSGWFSELFGRKRFLMVCVAVFSTASLFCGLAPNLTALILLRVVQGAGGGALQPVSQAIIVESYPPERRGMGMAVFGMGVVVAPILGPTLGGWITDSYSWRWIFFINVPVGVLSLLLIGLLIEDPPYLARRAKGVRIDFIGLGLLSLGLGCLQIVLDKGQRDDWFASNLILTLAIVAAVALVATVIWELRVRQPVIDLRMLRERNYGISTLTMFMLGAVLYGSISLLPIFLQTLLGYTALLSGLVLSPGALMALILMPIVGWLLGRVEARWLVLAGVGLVALSLFQMAGFNLQIDFRTAVNARIVQGLGLALLFVPINVMAFAFVPQERTNYASGLINLARNVGGSVGIAFATTMLARRAQFHQNILIGHLTPYNEIYRNALGHATRLLESQGSGAYMAAQQAHALFYGMVQKQAAMLAFVDAFRLLGFLFLAIVPLMFLMKRSSPKGRMTAGAAH